jgi:DNA repair exonuclease SbcCD ATPase subunit
LERALPEGWSLDGLRREALTWRQRNLDEHARRIAWQRHSLDGAVGKLYAKLSRDRAAALDALADAIGDRAMAAVRGQGQIAEKLRQAEKQLEGRPAFQRQLDDLRAEIEERRRRRQELWGAARTLLRTHAPDLLADCYPEGGDGEVDGLMVPSLPIRRDPHLRPPIPPPDDGRSYPGRDPTVSPGDRPEKMLAGLRPRRGGLDEAAVRAEREALVRRRGMIEAQEQAARVELERRQGKIREIVAPLGVEVPGEVAMATLLPILPGLASASTEVLGQLEAERFDVSTRWRAEDQRANELETTLRVGRGDLDGAACREEAAGLRRRKRICDQASTILDQVRENVLDSVLPNTLAYVRLLLPLLTAGRYHDAQLDSESYRIEVWDNQVQDFVEKDIFSGATQDQFSLALRLGFALAALPQERGARPGFLFLDEPVAGFDGQRRDALLNLLTSGDLASYFPQVLLAVPSGVFDRNPLPDLIRLDHGRVVESTLPGGGRT